VDSDEAQTRATHAKRLLEDPLLQEALGKIKAEAVDAWEKTAARDSEARELAWITVRVTNRITDCLQGMVDDGRIAAARVQAPLR
jgi:hypothetical protein